MLLSAQLWLSGRELCFARLSCWPLAPVTQADHRYQAAKKIRNPKNRQKLMIECCKGKGECVRAEKAPGEEGDDTGEGDEDAAADDEDEASAVARRVRSGGCGAMQPKYVLSGVKITAEFKARKRRPDEIEDEEGGAEEGKKHMTPDKVRHQ